MAGYFYKRTPLRDEVAKVESLCSMGAKLIVGDTALKSEFEKLGHTVHDTFKNALMLADVVIDCTPAGNKMKEKYSQQVEQFNELESKIKHIPLESELVTELYELIDTYKKSINDYITTKTATLLKDAVELYVEQIVPKQEEIRELIHMSVIEEDGEYRLVKRLNKQMI